MLTAKPSLGPYSGFSDNMSQEDEGFSKSQLPYSIPDYPGIVKVEKRHQQSVIRNSSGDDRAVI
jgi:hypothetical protein